MYCYSYKSPSPRAEMCPRLAVSTEVNAAAQRAHTGHGRAQNMHHVRPVIRVACGTVGSKSEQPLHADSGRERRADRGEAPRTATRSNKQAQSCVCPHRTATSPISFRAHLMRTSAVFAQPRPSMHATSCTIPPTGKGYRRRVAMVDAQKGARGGSRRR